MTSETRYERNSTGTVNGLTAYELGTSQTEASTFNQRIYVDPEIPLDGYWGIRVWKRSSTGVETEITNGQAAAIVSRTQAGSGLQSRNWNCPQTSMEPTDSLVVRVYMGVLDPPTDLVETFQTEQLGASRLDAATWTIYYWTYRAVGTPKYKTTLRYYWGSSDRNSHIENPTWSVTVTSIARRTGDGLTSITA